MSFITFPAIIEGISIRNTAIGTYSLSRVVPGALTGNANTAFGYASLQFTTTGRFNTAFGSEALQSNTTGNSNTAVGDYSLQNNFTGTFNTAIGRGALSSSDSSGSTAVGANAILNATGGGNTAVGYGAGSQITTGENNTIIGQYSGNQGGLDITNSSGYVVLSDGVGNPRLYIDNTGLVTAPGGFAGVGGTIQLNNKTAAYTVVAGDLGEIINCTANTFTVSLTAAATLGSGFNCWVWNTGTGTITIDPNGAETIDGYSTLTLRRGEGTQIVCNGTNWETGGKKTMRAYAENIQAANQRPIASGIDSVAIGTASLGGATASGLGSVAIGSISSAAATYSLAIGVDAAVTSGTYSSAIGVNSLGSGSRSVTGSAAMSLGGSYASGTDSFAAAVGNNTSTYGATQSNAVAIGYLAKAQGLYSAAIGFTCSSTATRTYTVGDTCTASAVRGFAFGSDAVSAFAGKQAYGNGSIAVAGDNQAGKTILKRRTTDATPTALTSDSTVAGASNQVILANNTAFAFTGTIVARQQAAGGAASAAWTVSGLIRREGTAASTALVASTVTTITNVPGWNLALSADTTNGGLAVTATGAVGINVQWTATIDTIETTYA